jgi:hypothetical protein
LASGSAPATATTVNYGGKKFDIIGYNKAGVEAGVAGPNNSVTLLLNKDEVNSNSPFNATDNKYQNSWLFNEMNSYILSTNNGIIDRTLTGGSTNSGHAGYNNDWIAGPTLNNQNIWPLSNDEALHLILSERNISSYWWLRTPGYNDFNALYVNNNGGVMTQGTDIDTNYAVRPALYLNMSNSVFTGINFDNNNLPIGACTREPTNLGIDYSAETVTGLDTATEGWKIGATYAGLGAFTPLDSSSSDIYGIITNTTQALVFVKAKDDNDHFDSDKDRNGAVQQSLATTINIPARPAGPSGLTGVAPSDVGTSDGKIAGTSNKMEYTQDPSLVTGLLGSGLLGASPGWTDITGGVLTGLTSGTYFVRTKADQSAKKFKSFAKEVIVKEGTAPSAGKPGSGTGPSAGDGGGSTEGTAKTGIDFATLELLALLMLAFSVIARSLRRGNLHYSEQLTGE